MTFEKGTYRARAVQGNAVLGFTKSGSEQVGVLLQLLEGPNEGDHITWYGYFSEKTVDRTLESLRYLGWQGNDINDLSTVGDASAPDVLAVIDDEQDDRTGEMRSRVRWINRIAGVAIKDRMSDDQAKAFAAKMKGRVIALDRKAGAPKTNGNAGGARRPPARDDVPPPPTDEDAPF